MNNDNSLSLVFTGVPTELYMNRIERDGFLFKGWTAYRVESNKWLYVNQLNNTQRVWAVEGAQPSGYIKYVYSDRTVVSQASSNGYHVLMCAQWQNTNKFYIKYFANGGSGTMSDQSIIHGTLTQLNLNDFIKTGKVFQGWYAYWTEKNKWLYTNSSGTKEWYQEGEQPFGFIKYRYTDGENVARTAHIGGHIYMYAVWNEFNVYYYANGISENNGILNEGG